MTVTEEVTLVFAGLDGVGLALDELEKALEPVLAPEPPASADDQADIESGIPLINELKGVVRRLEKTTSKVQGIHGRVGL